MSENKYTKMRAVRVPQLKMLPGNTYPFRCNSPMRTEASRDAKREGEVTIMEVTDLDDGAVKTIICGTVLRNLLNDESDYVGRCYLVEVGEMSSEDGWRQYYLWQIEDPISSGDVDGAVS